MPERRPVRWGLHRFPAAPLGERLQAGHVVPAEAAIDARVAAGPADQYLARAPAGVGQRVHGHLGLVHRAPLGEHLADRFSEGRSVDRTSAPLEILKQPFPDRRVTGHSSSWWL